MGSGKTSTLYEASDLLGKRQIAHAAIDVDALGIVFPLPSRDNNDVMYRNLDAVCKNYAALGITRLLLSRAIESRAELERCIDASSATNVVVCRLTASIATMGHRVREREAGIAQNDYVLRVATLNDILDDANLENFTVSTEARPVTEVTEEVLVKAGWISE